MKETFNNWYKDNVKRDNNILNNHIIDINSSNKNNNNEKAKMILDLHCFRHWYTNFKPQQIIFKDNIEIIIIQHLKDLYINIK